MALCGNASPAAPIATGGVCAKACAGSWQLEQLYRPVSDRRGSKNSRSPSAALACDMGLSGGTAGVGKPRGRCQAYSSAASGHAAASSSSAVVGRLARDLRSLPDPLVELVQAGGIAAGGGGALVGDPALHGREEFTRQRAVTRVQVEVGLLCVGDAIEREIRLAAILERIRVTRLEGERLVVGRERFLVVAELAARVAHVVPGLGKLGVQSRRLLELAQRLRIPVPGLVCGLVLLAGIGRLCGRRLRLVGLLHVVHAVVVGVARLLLRRLLAGHGRR